MNGMLRYGLRAGLCAGALVLAVLAGPAAGQFEVLVKSGDAAPDGDGVYDRPTGINFGTPAINDLGQVLFQASLYGSSAGQDIVTLVTLEGVLTEVAREGTATPFGPLDYGAVRRAGQARAAISDSGQPVFPARLDGPTTDPDAFVYGIGPAAGLVAVDGDLAPGDGTMTLRYGYNPAINASNQVAFSADLEGMSDAARAGLYRWDGAGPLVPIVRDKQPLPAGLGAGSFDAAGFAAPTLNSQGRVAFYSEIAGSGVVADAGIFVGDGASFTQIVRTDDPAPGGGTFYDRLNHPSLNDLGQVSFGAQLDDVAGVVRGIYRGDGGAIVEIARTGDPLPGGNSLTSIGVVSAINNAGQVVFPADTALVDTGTGAYAGLFRGDGDEITTIALGGMPVPGGDAVLSLSNDSFAINDAGQVAFLFGIDFDPSDVIPFEEKSLFFYDDTLGLIEIARTGTELLGSTIENIDFAGSNATDGSIPDELSGLNNNGVVTFRYDLANGDEGIAVWAIPEPASLALLVGGLALLRRRRA